MVACRRVSPWRGAWGQGFYFLTEHSARDTREEVTRRTAAEGATIWCRWDWWLAHRLLLGGYRKYLVSEESAWKEESGVIYLQFPFPYCSKISTLCVGFPEIPWWAHMGIRVSLAEFCTTASTGRQEAMMWQVHSVGKMKVLCGHLGTHTRNEWPMVPKRQSQEDLNQCMRGICYRKGVRQQDPAIFPFFLPFH